MKKIVDELTEESVGLQIAPLIDCVFLLLIYFMVTSSLKKSEADLGITLPGNIIQTQEIAMPDEQVIEIMADGRIVLNNTVYGKGNSRDLPDLVATLSRFKAACDNAKTKALITIFAEDDALHQRVIDTMNACSGARLKNITFGTGG